MTSPPVIEELPLLETASPAEIAQQTERLLLRHVHYVHERSPFYQELFKFNGIHSDRITSINDLLSIPPTTKRDLEIYNRDFLCVEDDQCIDVCQTSGTTGQPVSISLTEEDLQRLAYNEWRSFGLADIKCQDRVLLVCTLDRCFMAGMAYFLGLRRLRATVIRAGSTSPTVLAEAVRLHKPTALVVVPTMAMAIAKALSVSGIDPATLNVRKIIAIGEPVRTPELGLNYIGLRLRNAWRAEIHSTYASTEMATAFTDCCAFQGGHILPDLIHVEILDDNDSPLPPGIPGEVVATPLQVTGMPLLRVRTGDIAVLHTDPCPCGRSTYRLGPILGRKNQMLKCKGTTVYPPAITAVLQEIEEVNDYYLEVFDDHEVSDRITITVSLHDSGVLTAEEIAERIRARIRVRPQLVITSGEEVTARTMLPGRRKALRFFDFRSQKGI